MVSSANNAMLEAIDQGCGERMVSELVDLYPESLNAK
jgi:hypothetical protein